MPAFVVIVQTCYEAWVTTWLLYPLIAVPATAVLARARRVRRQPVAPAFFRK